MMKKIAGLFFAISLLIGLSACGSAAAPESPYVGKKVIDSGIYAYRMRGVLRCDNVPTVNTLDSAYLYMEVNKATSTVSTVLEAAQQAGEAVDDSAIDETIDAISWYNFDYVIPTPEKDVSKGNDFSNIQHFLPEENTVFIDAGIDFDTETGVGYGYTQTLTIENSIIIDKPVFTLNTERISERGESCTEERTYHFERLASVEIDNKKMDLSAIRNNLPNPTTDEEANENTDNSEKPVWDFTAITPTQTVTIANEMAFYHINLDDNRGQLSMFARTEGQPFALEVELYAGNFTALDKLTLQTAVSANEGNTLSAEQAFKYQTMTAGDYYLIIKPTIAGASVQLSLSFN